MQESEYDSVVWDTNIGGDHGQGSGSAAFGHGPSGTGTAAATSTSPLGSTHTSPFGGMGGGSHDLPDAGSGKVAAREPDDSGDVETEVTVDQPRKEGEGTSNPFVTYLVTTTRTNRRTREIRRYALRRRYQDFAWLHEQLYKQFVASVVPPLPDRRRLEYLTGDRFSEDFVGKRKHGLERFVRRVILHPLLRTSHHLTVFLEAKDWSSEYEI
ncbi:intercellular trafficking and secretion, partial [Coemansia sp. RSA 2611]